MSLGYALVHPVLVEQTASANPWRASFDDGVDVVVSVFGAGDLRPYADAFQEAVQTQFDEVGAQFAALVGPGGPLEVLAGLGDVSFEDLDIGGIVRGAGDLLCGLDATVAAGFVSGLVDDIAAALPVLSPVDLVPRIADLVDAVLGVLEAPLLSGRDDLEAHRAYRAAAVIRAQLGPLLDRLGELLAGIDVAAFIRGFLADASGSATLDVEPIRRLGCLLRDQIAPVVEGVFGCAAAFRVDVDIGGLEGMPDAVTLADDARPAPFPVNGSAVDSTLWALDLATNLLSLAATIANIAVTGNPVRGLRLFHFFADLLLPLWIAFRTLARAARWDFLDADRFSRFIFSDLGDFAVQFFLRFFGSFSDAFAFSNWISNVGLTLMKYHFLTLQPRSIYLFARSLWYVQTWKAEGRPADPGVPVHRYVWLAYTPVMFVGFIVGLFYGGLLTEFVSVRRVWLPITVGGILGLAMMWLALPIYGVNFGSITWPPGAGMFIGGTAVVLLLIGVLQFSQVSEFETNTGGQAALWTLFAVLLVLVVVGAALAGTDTTQRLNDGMTGFILFGPGAALVAGTLPQLLWWYYLAEGADIDDVFDALDPATSPYLLPFRSDEDWMCGQDNQGFWSHQAHDGAGFARDFNDGNRYSFDLNSARGSHCLAARSGLVVDLRDDQPTGNPNTANRLEIQHLDWVAGHDPGWEEERTLTYTWYLHVEERGIRATIGQHISRGHWVALLDDTGNSAMEHLHFSGAGGQNFNPADDDPIDIPIVFADGGRVHSLTFPRSSNTEIDGDAPVARPLAIAAGSTGHTHQALLRAADLAADGTIPSSVTLVTTPGSGVAHRHEVTLSDAQIRDLLEGRDVTAATTSVDGHTHPLGPAGPQAGWLEVPQGQVQLADPPSGRLVARTPAPYDLLGEQLFLRVDDRTTEWFTWGVHRPSLEGAITLDRGPVPGARVRLGTSPTVDVQTANHLMARAAAAALATAAEAGGMPIAIRLLPVLVIETRRRGTSASLAITAAPPGLEVLSSGDGSGDVPDLSLSVAALRTRISDELVPAAGVPAAAVTGTGSTRTFTVNGNPVTDVSGSTPRIAAVLGALLSAGTVTDRNHLPLSAGRLRLVAGADALDVPIAAAPARVVIPDLAAARLTGDDLVAEPLLLTVRDDVQLIRFEPGDDSAPGVAGRIANSAEGVRAWAEGSSVVIETVAAGDEVTLALSKVGGTFPDVTAGAAPPLGAADPLADSTAMTLDELAALVDTARAEAVRPALPLTVGGSGGTIRLEATAGAGTIVAVEGPRDLMAALGVAAAAPTDRTARREGDGAVELTGLPATVNLPTGGWLDITVGGDTARVSLAAEPARGELLVRDLTAAGGDLGLTVNGATVTVALGPGDITSRNGIAGRITATTADVAVRTAYRYAIEWGLHGEVVGGTLTLSVATGAVGLPAVGFTDALVASSGRAHHDDVTALPELARVADRHGTVVRAFSAAVVDAGTASERVEITSADGQGLGITSFGRDPLGLTPAFVPVPPPATRSVTGAIHDLGAACVAYDVAAADTVTTVELNAAPAHLHTTLGSAPTRLPDDGEPVLGVITTDPAGTTRRVDVNLRGASTVAELAARLQADAPHVVAWSSLGHTRLNVDTPGGGTGWRLRLEGRAILVTLGFDVTRIDAAGGIDAVGHGNVVDGAAVTLAEIAEVFDTVGGLAARDPSGVYTAVAGGTDLTVASLQGPVALRSDPPSITGALAPVTAAGVVTVSGASFALDSGWLFVDVGSETLGAALLWGRRAWVESDPVDDADVDAFSGDVRLTIDGVAAGAVTVTAATTTVADLVDQLSLAAPTAWVGWILRSDGNRVLRVESRSRGSGSAVIVTLSAPGLGFGSAVTSSPGSGPGSGDGSVDDLGRVTPSELASLLVGGRGTTDAPQDAVEASAATGLLRFVARGGQGVALTVVAAPDGLTPTAVPLRPDVAEFAYPAPLDTGPDATVLTVTPPAGGAGARTVRAVLRATPARLGAMTLPASLADLNGRTLRMTADGTTATVTFAGVTAAADVIAQVQRGMDWRVRATVAPGPPDRLLVETVREGTSAALSAVTDAAVSTAFAVLGLPSPATASGAGDTADVRSVPAADVAAVVDRGLLGADPATDTSSQLALEVQQGSVGTTLGAAAGLEFRGRVSNRSGCASSVAVLPASGAAGTFAAALAAGPAVLDFDRSLARGPAVRAAVALPPFVNAAGDPVERTLSGSLGIRLDDHGAGSDFAPATTVIIDFDGSFSAAAAAAVIDEALADRGVGRAAAYPDSVVVIETNTDGLAGRVTVPAPDAPGDAAVLDALGLDAAAPLDERGWPRNGMRSSLTTARGDAAWRFVAPLTGGGTSPPIDLAVSAGQAAADVATALNALLRDFTGALPPSDGRNRVGLAVAGADGALLAEFFVPGVVFTIAGTPLAPVPGGQRWLGTEPAVDDALELRPTTLLRTFRMVYVRGEGGRETFCDPAAFDPSAGADPDFPRFDVGWIRPPTDANGLEQPVQRWAPGRWLLSARAAGARSDTFAAGLRVPGYAASGEMIVSGGAATGPDGQPLAFAHRVRYWLSLTRNGDLLAPLRVVRVGDELLTDFVIHPG